MEPATNKFIPVGVVLNDVPSLDSIEAIMWLRKPSDIEPELSRYEGNKDFLYKLAA